jgi:hypothetical protein
LSKNVSRLFYAAAKEHMLAAGPNNYDCISSPATPQTGYGDIGNSYHVGGGYQARTFKGTFH